MKMDFKATLLYDEIVRICIIMITKKVSIKFVAIRVNCFLTLLISMIPLLISMIPLLISDPTSIRPMINVFISLA